MLRSSEQLSASQLTPSSPETRMQAHRITELMRTMYFNRKLMFRSGRRIEVLGPRCDSDRSEPGTLPTARLSCQSGTIRTGCQYRLGRQMKGVYRAAAIPDNCAAPLRLSDHTPLL
jgi:hypothetical protein